MAAMQESEHRRATHADALERAANAEIPARREQTFFERLDGFGCAARLVIYLRQIQIKLRVIALHADRLAAQSFRVAETPLRDSCQQAGVRKIERIFWGYAQRAARVHQGIGGRAVAQSPQTFL